MPVHPSARAPWAGRDRPHGTAVRGGDAIATGDSAPPGATVAAGAVNFSVFSKDADLVELLLFDDPQATEAAETIPLDPRAHRTYHYWHAFVPGLGAGQVYAYRAHGPFAPERGLRFDSDKVLLDPYGLAVAVPGGWYLIARLSPARCIGVALLATALAALHALGVALGLGALTSRVSALRGV